MTSRKSCRSSGDALVATVKALAVSEVQMVRQLIMSGRLSVLDMRRAALCGTLLLPCVVDTFAILGKSFWEQLLCC